MLNYQHTAIHLNIPSTKMAIDIFWLSRIHMHRSVKSLMKVLIGRANPYRAGYIDHLHRIPCCWRFMIVHHNWKWLKIDWLSLVKRDIAWFEPLTVCKIDASSSIDFWYFDYLSPLIHNAFTLISKRFFLCSCNKRQLVFRSDNWRDARRCSYSNRLGSRVRQLASAIRLW